MTGDNTMLAIVGLLVGAWLIAAVAIIWTGLTMRQQARQSLRQTSRLARLLETAPAVPAVVRSDGKIEGSEKLARMLGSGSAVNQLTDLSSLLRSPSEWSELERNVREAQRSAKGFQQTVGLAGSEKRFLVRGNLADPHIYPNGGALLWFFDLSDSARENELLAEQYQTARSAFEALAGLIEAAPIPMWHRGRDFHLTFVNKAYVDAVGGESGDAVVQQGIELIEPVNGETAMSHAAKSIDADGPVERIVSTTIAQQRRQVRAIDIPLGQVGVAGLAIDVQDLIDAQADFRRLAAAQRELLDKMTASVAQFGPDHTLTFANLPFLRTFELREDWIAARPEFARVLERMREHNKLPEVRDFPMWRAEKENWFVSAAPVEDNWLLPNGTHLRLLVQPTPDGGLWLIFEDRTEQAQLASARDTLLRVRTATFDNLFEAIAVFGGDGKLSIWNRRFGDNWGLDEELLARHPRFDDMLSTLAERLKKASQISILRELLQMTIANREPRRSKMEFANGQVFELSTVPLPDGNALLTMFDVTDSVQIEQALRERNSALAEADSVKGRFLANMSYEFRTPLTSIAGFADLLKQGIAGELTPQAAEYVDAIAKSADRLSQQINTVLDFSQSEAGALPLTRKPVDVAALVETVVANIAADATETGSEINTDIKPNSGSIAGDAKRLEQALSHIIANAITHGGAAGPILVHASGDRTKAVIMVSDNGPGMSAAEQAAALDGFGKGGHNAKGLGLPLARQLVEAHGGKLTLESSPGKGTSVYLHLPRNAA